MIGVLTVCPERPETYFWVLANTFPGRQCVLGWYRGELVHKLDAILGETIVAVLLLKRLCHGVRSVTMFDL